MEDNYISDCDLWPDILRLYHKYQDKDQYIFGFYMHGFVYNQNWQRILGDKQVDCRYSLWSINKQHDHLVIYTHCMVRMETGDINQQVEDILLKKKLDHWQEKFKKNLVLYV